MQHLFMDESGTLAFSENSNQYFILALVAPVSGKALNKFAKNFNGHLVRNGWNANVEIKASNLWRAEKNGDVAADYSYKKTPAVPMRHFFEGLSKIDLFIEYVAIKLDTVKPGMRRLPHAILYGHFAWLLLKNSLVHFPDVGLYCDRHKREQHDLLKFNGYIEYQACIERAVLDAAGLNLQILHYHAKSAEDSTGLTRANIEFGLRGIQVADFVCWALRAKFENNHNDWMSLLEKRIKSGQILYVGEPEPQKKGS